MNAIVGVGISSTIKLSKAIEVFEQFGDIIRTSIDSKRRQKFEKINIFITYADVISGKRALEAGYVIINGEKVLIENPRKRKAEDDEQSTDQVGRFKISKQVTKISSTSSRERSSESERTSREKFKRQKYAEERKKSPPIKSFVRRNNKQKQD